MIQVIRTADITGCDETSFNRFVGELVWCEMARLNISACHLRRTEKTKAPDDGIDLQVLQGPQSDGWLPPGQSAWQFKSGACPSARELAGTTKARTKAPSKRRLGSKKVPEFQKPGVLEAVKQGHTYVFVAADDLGQKKTKDIETEFRNVHGSNAKVVVYGATQLVSWASELPGVAIAHFDCVGCLSRWISFGRWSSLPSTEATFYADTARTDLIGQIGAAIRGGERFVHLAGRAGDGKTRLALEACRAEDLAVRTLYLGQQSEFDSALINQASQIGMNAIFVVDECDDIEELRKRAECLPSGCSIMGIDHAPSDLATYGLPRLDDAPLAAMLRDRVPALAEDEAGRIVRRCGGSPKLVHFLADNKNTDWFALERSRGLDEWLQKTYPLEGNDEQRVMHAICLFSRLGRTRPHDDELSILSSWLSLDRDCVAHHLDALLAKGILSPRGFSVYPTPDVLANILARVSLGRFGSRGGYGSHPREMIAEIRDNGQLDWSHSFAVEEGNDVTPPLSNRRLDSTRRPPDLE
jgi:hypothetical protein